MFSQFSTSNSPLNQQFNPMTSNYEKEQILFGSSKKVDDPFFSSQMNSNNNFNFNRRNIGTNYIDNLNTPFTISNRNNTISNFNSNFIGTSSRATEFTFNNNNSSKQKSYQIYRNLLIKNKFSKALLPNKEINFNDYTRMPHELANVNFPFWIEKYKKFLVLTLLEDFINEHDNNIINLNQMLEFTNIQLITTLPEEEPNSLTEILNTKFNDTNSFLFKNNLNGKIKNNFNENNNTVKVFFGDTGRISKIITFIDYKLKMCQKKNLNNQNGYSSINKENQPYRLNNNDESISNMLKKHNPFLKVANNMDYKDLINKNKILLEENLINLKQLLLYRIILNEKLFPKYYINSLTDKHAHLVIEYSIGRLRELKSNLNYYKNNCGGKFIGENWTSAFPTDSQLLSYLSIQFMEDVYKDSYLRKLFMISFPLAPSKITFINII